MLKIILAGSRSFGKAVFEELRIRHEVQAVWVPEQADTLAAAALEIGVPVVEGASDVLFADWRSDLIVGAHNHLYIPERMRATTRLGALAYHPSLLPRHRGRDAVRWTIHMRDPIAGGTVYWLDNGVDTGPIAAQDWCHVAPHWDASELWRERLFPMGLELLIKVLDDVDRGEFGALDQDPRFATWEPAWERPPLEAEVPA